MVAGGRDGTVAVGMRAVVDFGCGTAGGTWYRWVVGPDGTWRRGARAH